MCGILGVLSLVPHKPVRYELEPALVAMDHRGPDARTQWRAKDSSIALGHTRLSIIDLEDGTQPLSNEDGSIRAVVNGEFYDFEAIRQRLIQRGHRFATGSDSEILIHLYEEHGVDAVHKLRGEFAFVLWDGRQQKLFAARDRFGIKPLCFTTHEDTLCIASTARALFALGVPASWNMEALHQCMHAQYPLPHQTLFDQIKQLEPGHLLLATQRSGVRIRPYWDLNYLQENTDEATHQASAYAQDPGEAIERVHHLLSEAVGFRMRADVEVACYLSGGIDSCAILGLASRHNNAPMTAYTLSFDDDAYDELPIAKEMADDVGATLIPVTASRRMLLEHMHDAVVHGEGLVINGHQSAKYLLSRAVQAQGHRVVLVGEGSDEIFAGYPHLRQDLATHRAKDLANTNTLASGIFLPHGQTLDVTHVARVLGYIPTFVRTKAGLGFRNSELMRSDVLEHYSRRDAWASFLNHVDVHQQLHQRHPVHQSMYLWTKSSLANYILRLIGDGTEMAHSIEGRVPFLDHHLVEEVVRLPLCAKIHHGVEKHILRKAMNNVVTPTVRHRQKHALLSPPCAADPDVDGHNLVQDILRSHDFERSPFFDAARVRDLLDRLPNMSAADRARHDPCLMMALSTCFLSKEFGL